MASIPWVQVRDVVDAVLDLPPEARSSYLDQACPGPALRPYVESLIHSYEQAGNFLDEPAAIHDAYAPAQQEAGSWKGRRLGSYRIIEQVGEGGMGEVYRAVRADDQYQKQVAIKLVRVGFDSRFTLARLKAERQILANLDHPNITRLLDGGATEDGQPYLVMEYVHGLPLDEYCDRYKLTVTERLQLFRTVCAAVQYAHQKLVIHRDIKPGNILVTEDGIPKLLDFGIAKVFGPETSGAAAVRTLTMVRLLTPEYASPEQLRGGMISTASDVYSLGVVLYELLTGHLPYRPPNRSLEEIARTMTETEPEKPSSAIRWVEEITDSAGKPLKLMPEAVSNTREGSPEKLRRRLAGDLDTIALMALRKEPQRRYPSVEELSEDIRRHLHHMPVRARKDTIIYRTGRFVRRNAPAAIATALLVLVLMAGSGTAIWQAANRRPALTGTSGVVLADFTNNTGDSVFDETLKQALRVQLEQSPLLKVLSDVAVRQELAYMRRSGEARLPKDLAREVCQRTDSRVMVAGSISTLGSQYVIGLEALDCQSGDLLGSEQEDVDRREHILRALSGSATKLRRKLGESLASVQKFNRPLEQATTPSLEALRAFTLGRRIQDEQGSPESIPYYRRSVEVDPNFAEAYAALGTAYNNVNQPALAMESYKRAFALRDRVSERERFYIEAGYHSNVTGDLERANQIYSQWARVYPEEGIAHLDLGFNYASLGQYEKALHEYLQDLRLVPEDAIGYGNLVSCYLALGRLDQAKVAFEQASARKLDGPDLRLPRYYLAFLEGDRRAMDEQVAWAVAKAHDEGPLLSAQADTEAYYGHRDRARDLSKRAVKADSRDDSTDTGGIWRLNAVLRELEFGDPSQAQEAALTALASNPGHNVTLLAALLLARGGDLEKTRKLIDSLEREYPQDTLTQGYWLPAIRGALELARGNAGRGIKFLQPASAYEAGAPPQYLVATMYPVYIRGQLYLKAGQAQQAAAEFQKILDHRGVVLNYPLGALAHVQLARARAMSGDLPAARKAYQDFLGLWKDADADVPVLKRVKAEYARLGRLGEGERSTHRPTIESARRLNIPGS